MFKCMFTLFNFIYLKAKQNKVYNSFGQIKKLQFTPNDDKLFAICSITELSTCLCQYKCVHYESRKLSTSHSIDLSLANFNI